MKTTYKEETDRCSYSFFEPNPVEHLAPRDAAAMVRQPEEAFLDRFLSLVKWVFLYIPGVAFLHLLIVGFGLSLLYEISPGEILVEMLGAGVIGTFMVMLGVGKLSDLKYLRVVGAIVAASSLAAILYLILAAFIPGDFYGRFYQMSLPVILLVGYLMKRHTDAVDGPSD